MTTRDITMTECDIIMATRDMRHQFTMKSEKTNPFKHQNARDHLVSKLVTVATLVAESAGLNQCINTQNPDRNG